MDNESRCLSGVEGKGDIVASLRLAVGSCAAGASLRLAVGRVGEVVTKSGAFDSAQAPGIYFVRRHDLHDPVGVTER